MDPSLSGVFVPLVYHLFESFSFSMAILMCSIICFQKLTNRNPERTQPMKSKYHSENQPWLIFLLVWKENLFHGTVDRSGAPLVFHCMSHRIRHQNFDFDFREYFFSKNNRLINFKNETYGGRNSRIRSACVWVWPTFATVSRPSIIFRAFISIVLIQNIYIGWIPRIFQTFFEKMMIFSNIFEIFWHWNSPQSPIFLLV